MVFNALNTISGLIHFLFFIHVYLKKINQNNNAMFYVNIIHIVANSILGFIASATTINSVANF
jgi:hypothetical protein